MKLWLDSLLHLIVPHSCLLCKSPIKSGQEDICIICGYELNRFESMLLTNSEVAKTFWGRVKLEHAWAFLLLKQGNSVQKVIHQLKYHGRQSIGKTLGGLMADEIIKAHPDLKIDVIIPMPLHKRKQLIRGYNQCSSIAHGLSQRIKTAVREDIIERKAYQDSQTDKNRMERWQNVQQTFICNQPEILIDKHVLLVDDVLTTGATIDACLQTINSIENIKISVACLAFAP